MHRAYSRRIPNLENYLVENSVIPTFQFNCVYSSEHRKSMAGSWYWVEVFLLKKQELELLGNNDNITLPWRIRPISI